MITAEYFAARVGRDHQDDDLERSNCPDAGEDGHWYCGWDEEADLPEFMTARRMKRKLQENADAVAQGEDGTD